MRVSHIFCEDTRISKKLLSLLSQKYSIPCEPKTFISFHSHNENEILSSLHVKDLQEKEYAFVSDAGMPCISDPGAKMVKFCQENDISYEIYSGANALLLAYSASGFLEPEFSFFGFLPHKGKEREDALNKVLSSAQNTILYESPHRLIKLLEQIQSIDSQRELFLIKEATKKFEQKFFGKVKEIYEKMLTLNVKGEWVVVIKKAQNLHVNSPLHVKDILELDLKPKQKAKLLAKITNESANIWYQKLCDEKK